MTLAQDITAIRNEQMGDDVVAAIIDSANYFPATTGTGSNFKTTRDYLEDEKILVQNQTTDEYSASHTYRIQTMGGGYADIIVESEYVYKSAQQITSLEIPNAPNWQFESRRYAVIRQNTTYYPARLVLSSNTINVQPLTALDISAGDVVRVYTRIRCVKQYAENPIRAEITAKTDVIDEAVYGAELKKGILDYLRYLRDAGTITEEDTKTYSSSTTQRTTRTDYYYRRDSKGFMTIAHKMKLTYLQAAALSPTYRWFSTLAVTAADDRRFPAIIKRKSPGGTITYHPTTAYVIAGDNRYYIDFPMGSIEANTEFELMSYARIKEV